MRTQSLDTSPEAEQIQIELLQKATVAQRFAMTCVLSRTAMELSRRALRRARPGASEREIELEFVAPYYGQELADQLRDYLTRRQR